MRLGVLATHPIQYHAPLYRALAERVDLHVYFAHRQTPKGQAEAGFGVEFEWDVPLLDGYEHTFIVNRSSRPSTATFSGCNTPQIREIIASERFDAFCVSGWYNRSYVQAITSCWRTGTPLMVRGDSHLGTPRSRIRSLAKEAFFRQFIPRFDHCLYVGERSREYYLHYGASPDRLHFSPHHVDNEWFSTTAAATAVSAVREEWGISPSARVVLFVGKLIPVKRPADAIEAVLVAREMGSDLHLVFVGSGPLEEHLRSRATTLDLPVTFAGFKNQSQLPACYASADVLVLPSQSETWGLAVNEAMACGLPAVVSDAVGCAPDLIDDGETGMTFPVGDINDLALALKRSATLKGESGVTSRLKAKMATYSVSRAADGFTEALTVAYA